MLGFARFRLTRAAVTLLIMVVFAGTTWAFDEPSEKPASKPQVGVVANQPGAFEGYTLVFPLQSKKTYLVDMQGRVVKTWESKYTPGQEAYILENGHL